MDTRYTRKEEQTSASSADREREGSRRGPQPRPSARIHAVTVKMSAEQVARFETACAAAGLPRSKAGAVAIVRWTSAVLAEHGG